MAGENLEQQTGQQNAEAQALSPEESSKKTLNELKSKADDLLKQAKNNFGEKSSEYQRMKATLETDINQIKALLEGLDKAQGTEIQQIVEQTNSQISSLKSQIDEIDTQLIDEAEKNEIDGYIQEAIGKIEGLGFKLMSKNTEFRNITKAQLNANSLNAVFSSLSFQGNGDEAAAQKIVNELKAKIDDRLKVSSDNKTDFEYHSDQVDDNSIKNGMDKFFGSLKDIINQNNQNSGERQKIINMFKTPESKRILESVSSQVSQSGDNKFVDIINGFALFKQLKGAKFAFGDNVVSQNNSLKIGGIPGGRGGIKMEVRNGVPYISINKPDASDADFGDLPASVVDKNPGSFDGLNFSTTETLKTIDTTKLQSDLATAGINISADQPLRILNGDEGLGNSTDIKSIEELGKFLKDHGISIDQNTGVITLTDQIGKISVKGKDRKESSVTKTESLDFDGDISGVENLLKTLPGFDTKNFEINNILSKKNNELALNFVLDGKDGKLILDKNKKYIVDLDNAKIENGNLVLKTNPEETKNGDEAIHFKKSTNISATSNEIVTTSLTDPNSLKDNLLSGLDLSMFSAEDQTKIKDLIKNTKLDPDTRTLTLTQNNDGTRNLDQSKDGGKKLSINITGNSVDGGNSLLAIDNNNDTKSLDFSSMPDWVHISPDGNFEPALDGISSYDQLKASNKILLKGDNGAKLVDRKDFSFLPKDSFIFEKTLKTEAPKPLPNNSKDTYEKFNSYENKDLKNFFSLENKTALSNFMKNINDKGDYKDFIKSVNQVGYVKAFDNLGKLFSSNPKLSQQFAKIDATQVSDQDKRKTVDDVLEAGFSDNFLEANHFETKLSRMKLGNLEESFKNIATKNFDFKKVGADYGTIETKGQQLNSSGNFVVYSTRYNQGGIIQEGFSSHTQIIGFKGEDFSKGSQFEQGKKTFLESQKFDDSMLKDLLISKGFPENQLQNPKQVFDYLTSGKNINGISIKSEAVSTYLVGACENPAIRYDFNLQQASSKGEYSPLKPTEKISSTKNIITNVASSTFTPTTSSSIDIPDIINVTTGTNASGSIDIGNGIGIKTITTENPSLNTIPGETSIITTETTTTTNTTTGGGFDIGLSTTYKDPTSQIDIKFSGKSEPRETEITGGGGGSNEEKKKKEEEKKKTGEGGGDGDGTTKTPGNIMPKPKGGETTTPSTEPPSTEPPKSTPPSTEPPKSTPPSTEPPKSAPPSTEPVTIPAGDNVGPGQTTPAQPGPGQSTENPSTPSGPPATDLPSIP